MDRFPSQVEEVLSSNYDVDNIEANIILGKDNLLVEVSAKKGDGSICSFVKPLSEIEEEGVTPEQFAQLVVN